MLSKHLVLSMAGFCALLLSHSVSADNSRDFAEDLATALCGVLAAPAGNAAMAASGLVCKYATRAADSAVKSLIDEYFDGEDQKFVDATCSTLVYADGRQLKPSAGSGCK